MFLFLYLLKSRLTIDRKKMLEQLQNEIINSPDENPILTLPIIMSSEIQRSIQELHDKDDY